MINNEPMYINGDCETSRKFCFVSDAVKANLRAAMVIDEPVPLSKAKKLHTPLKVN